MNTPQIIRFRPVSPDDFSRYAKNVAWLVQLPLQRSRNLLAQIYGYSCDHELQEVLKATPVSPYSSSGQDFGAGTTERGSRCLALVAEAKGMESKAGLSHRDVDIRNIGLFDAPANHRALFRVIKLKHELLDGLDAMRQPATDGRAAHEYATLGRTAAGDEYILHFTDLGHAVFDAVSHVIDRNSWQPEERAYSRETVVRKLRAIVTIHPNNPWPAAAITDFIGRSFDGPMENPGAIFDIAKQAIALFEELYDGHEMEAPSHNLLSLHADTFYWPSVLFWGGLAALQCGQAKIGRKWLRANRKLCPDDNFGVRYVL